MRSAKPAGIRFRDYQLPEAVIKFKQGFGRLIRTRTDHGTVVCLDPRIVSKPYGKLFIESLPDCRRVAASLKAPMPGNAPKRVSTLNCHYSIERDLTPDEFIDVLRRSTLAERRPVDDLATIAGMLANADIIVAAHDDAGLLIGVSRADYRFPLLHVPFGSGGRPRFQRQGIGRELIRRTHEAAGLKTRLILLSAPAASTYYPHIGMRPHDSCWMIDPKR